MHPYYIDRRRALSRIAGLAAGGMALGHPLVTAAAALPDGWPNKPVRLLIPTSPGSQTDLFARWIGAQLAKAFGQPFVPENKPGASGNLAAMAVVGAPADGYSLLFSAASFTIVPAAMRSDMPYDLLRDLVPMVQIGAGGLILAVTPDLPAKSVQELFELARKEPGKFSYGSTGIGSTAHLIMASLLSQRGLQMTHVPYKSSAEVLRDLGGGVLQIGWVDSTTALGAIQAGKVRALAQASTYRMPRLPDMPTFNDVGIAWTLNGWLGLFTRAGTPLPIVRAINAEVNRSTHSDDGSARLAAMNLANPPPTSPEQFTQMLRNDLAAWRKIALDNNIKPES